MFRENCRLSKDDSSETDKVWVSRSKNRAAEAEIKSKEDEEKNRQGESQPNIAPVCVFILVPVSSRHSRFVTAAVPFTSN